MNFQELIEAHNKPELAKVDCEMVWQVWGDGEVTLQKCGSLLWMRTLHLIYPALSAEPIATLPETYKEHTFMFTDEAGCKAIRAYFEATLNNSRL
jgi:hypothetical protein